MSNNLDYYEQNNPTSGNIDGLVRRKRDSYPPEVPQYRTTLVISWSTDKEAVSIDNTVLGDFGWQQSFSQVTKRCFYLLVATCLNLLLY